MKKEDDVYNSDYLAMQTLQRHQAPDESYKVYNQYRDEKGSPIYPHHRGADCSRDGKQDDIFVQCRNLDRVRVVVE